MNGAPAENHSQSAKWAFAACWFIARITSAATMSRSAPISGWITGAEVRADFNWARKQNEDRRT
jgi:hypothetical protein